MPLSKIESVALVGLEAISIDVEVDSRKADKPSIIIVGLPDTAVKESKDRVLTAIRNSGFTVDMTACTVNLAPGDLRKEGPLYDLPIAIGILHSLNIIPDNAPLHDYLIVGELSLGGELRPIQGALAIALLAKAKRKKGVLLPASNAKEAAAVPHIDVIPINSLKDAVQFLKAPHSVAPLQCPASVTLFANEVPTVDFADIKGQAHVKRAMEIAAAGGHNIVLSGPPGSGKTMIAKALIGIMPELTLEEALETTRIYSVAGLVSPGQSLITQRPFRSPHHTISYAGLIGGGSSPRPGEVSLAHNGILFLDELPEFSRSVLEVLRQPLEDRKVTISRASGSFIYPTSFVCVAAMNPCPCGMLGHPDKPCKDSASQIDRYRSKISGPLWDRLDMHIEVPALRYRDLTASAPSESSQTVRTRVKATRTRQHVRFAKVRTNAQMTPAEMKKFIQMEDGCQDLLRQAVDSTGLSARGTDRLLRVSLTIADLDHSSIIRQEHLMEAINFRNQLQTHA